MDLIALVGVLIGFAAIISGNSLEGGQFSSLINTPAALIVLGGTFGAVIFQTPTVTLRGALGRAIWMFFPPAIEFDESVAKVVRWSKLARKDGMLGLEEQLNAEQDKFTRKALELLVDGSDPVTIRRALDIEVDSRATTDGQMTRVYRSLGGYAPTVGILGAVLGLIHVMGNLGEPDQLGAGIATAFVATIYGVGSANLVFLPMADRLQAISNRASMQRELLAEGVVSIAEGENPRTIELRLKGYASG